jgi:hypothetical protein
MLNRLRFSLHVGGINPRRKTKMKNKIITLQDFTSVDRHLDAAADSKASVEAARKEYIAQQLRHNPQVGQLSSGKFYAHIGMDRIYFESFFIGRVIDRLADHAKG